MHGVDSANAWQRRTGARTDSGARLGSIRQPSSSAPKHPQIAQAPTPTPLLDVIVANAASQAAAAPASPPAAKDDAAAPAPVLVVEADSPAAPLPAVWRWRDTAPGLGAARRTIGRDALQEQSQSDRNGHLAMPRSMSPRTDSWPACRERRSIAASPDRCLLWQRHATL
jgi:hypothetical protein